MREQSEHQQPATNVPSIVVGLDETGPSRAALRFALREAVRRGSALDVVTAWSWHALGEDAASEDGREWTRAYAQEVQDKAMGAVLGENRELPLLSRQVVEGEAAQVLLRVARTADYLVIGAGHKGPLRRALLGSVGEHCVRHATCAVLVVPVPPSTTADIDSRLSA